MTTYSAIKKKKDSVAMFEGQERTVAIVLDLITVLVWKHWTLSIS